MNSNKGLCNWGVENWGQFLEEELASAREWEVAELLSVQDCPCLLGVIDLTNEDSSSDDEEL